MEKETLNKLKPGSIARVYELKSEGAIRQRLQDLGVIPGASIECLYSSKGGAISAYQVCGSVIALRCEDAENILTEPCGVIV